MILQWTKYQYTDKENSNWLVVLVIFHLGLYDNEQITS